MHARHAFAEHDIHACIILGLLRCKARVGSGSAGNLPEPAQHITHGCPAVRLKSRTPGSCGRWGCCVVPPLQRACVHSTAAMYTRIDEAVAGAGTNRTGPGRSICITALRWCRGQGPAGVCRANGLPVGVTPPRLPPSPPCSTHRLPHCANDCGRPAGQALRDGGLPVAHAEGGRGVNTGGGPSV